MISARQAGLIHTGMATLVCDLSGVTPSALAVDALARLALALRRQGSRLRLRNASAELVELIEFMGLAEVLAVEPSR
jgi:anti-anti-sigma regulatory factor